MMIRRRNFFTFIIIVLTLICMNQKVVNNSSKTLKEFKTYAASSDTYEVPDVMYENSMGISTWEELSSIFPSSVEFIDESMYTEENISRLLLDQPLDENVQLYLMEKADEYELPFELLMSLIYQESSYRYDAVSPDGSYGLMQVRYTNHQWLNEELGLTDFYDPYQNIDGGVFILDHYRENYNPENYHQLLMMYNAGPTSARKSFNNGMYSSKYSRSIMNRAIEFGM